MALVKILNIISGGTLLLGSIGAILSTCTFTVDRGQRALKFSRFDGGIIDKAYGEGMHFYIPWFERPINLSIRTQVRKINSEPKGTPSKDLQLVNVTLRLLYRPEEKYLPFIFKTVGKDFAETLLPSFGNEILTSVIAQYDATELITQREQVSQIIRDSLIERCRTYHMILDDVSITHLAFSPEFTAAIERKQVAQQEAERSKYLVDRAKQEALANYIRAQGESEAADLLTKATGPGFVELRRLEAAKDIAESLAASKNVIYVPSGLNFLFDPKTFFTKSGADHK